MSRKSDAIKVSHQFKFGLRNKIDEFVNFNDKVRDDIDRYYPSANVLSSSSIETYADCSQNPIFMISLRNNRVLHGRMPITTHLDVDVVEPFSFRFDGFMDLTICRSVIMKACRLIELYNRDNLAEFKHAIKKSEFQQIIYYTVLNSPIYGLNAPTAIAIIRSWLKIIGDNITVVKANNNFSSSYIIEVENRVRKCIDKYYVTSPSSGSRPIIFADILVPCLQSTGGK